ncbi:MAG: helix-turn-helix domain-containing protein [Acidimicrobiales bacterium]
MQAVNMRDMQMGSQNMHEAQRFFRAEQVSEMLGIDRSTVYRMAENGRLPAMKVGRQWRFPAEHIAAMLGSPGGDLAAVSAPSRRTLLRTVGVALPLIELAAELLGVMMVLTDMAGEPVTEIINPCPWFSEHSDDPSLMAKCLADWKQLAEDPDFEIRFRTGPLDFDCARAFVRIGSRLVGMLVAGGLAATDDDDRALYRLGDEGQARVLASLPTIAAKLSRISAGMSSELDTRSNL